MIVRAPDLGLAETAKQRRTVMTKGWKVTMVELLNAWRHCELEANLDIVHEATQQYTALDSLARDLFLP